MDHHDAGVATASQLGHCHPDVVFNTDLDECSYHVVVDMGDDHCGLRLALGAWWPAKGPLGGGGGGLCLLVGTKGQGWRQEVEIEGSRTWREVHWNAMGPLFGDVLRS